EIELSLVSRQCLGSRRIADLGTLAQGNPGLEPPSQPEAHQDQLGVHAQEGQKVIPVTAVQNRHKNSGPCCKRELGVPGTGILRLRSTSVSLRLLSKSRTVRGRTGL